MRGRGVVVGVVSLAFACGEGRTVLEFPTTETMGTELLFFTAGDETVATVVDLQSQVVTFDSPLLERDVVAEAWILEPTPEALGLVPGRLPFKEAGEEGALLFAPVEVFGAEIVDGAASPWSPREPSENIADKRLPGAVLDCLERGCFEDGLCRVPCDPPEPEAPVLPSAPRLDGCPTDWTTQDDPVSACERWLGSCREDAFRAPGGPCVPRQATCSMAPDPTGAVVVFEQGGPSLAEAIANGAAIIALEDGEHAAPAASITQPVTLRGGCASGAHVRGALRIVGAAVRLEDLTIDGSLEVEDGDITLERVAISGEVALEAGALVARGVHVEGATVAFGGEVELDGVVITGAHVQTTTAAFVDARRTVLTGGASASFTRAIGRWTDSVWNEVSGVLQIASSSSVSVTRGFVRQYGGPVEVRASALQLVDFDIRDSRFLYAIDVQIVDEDIPVELRRVRIVDAVDAALQSVGAGARVTGSDLTIEDVRPSGVQLGRGMNINAGGEVAMDRVSIVRTNRHAIRLGDMSTLRVTDLRIEDVALGSVDPDDPRCPRTVKGQDGITATCNVTVILDRFLIRGTGCGIAFDGDTLQATNGRIADSDFGFCHEPPDHEHVLNVRVDGGALFSDFPGTP
ncbi:MAG: hypothetical protein RIT81_15125 [Deltaproteobacteria bacterium]